jgi:hypothetical protein
MNEETTTTPPDTNVQTVTATTDDLQAQQSQLDKELQEVGSVLFRVRLLYTVHLFDFATPHHFTLFHAYEHACQLPHKTCSLKKRKINFVVPHQQPSRMIHYETNGGVGIMFGIQVLLYTYLRYDVFLFWVRKCSPRAGVRSTFNF